MASNKAKRQKKDDKNEEEEDILLLDDDEDESYSARVRKRLAEKSRDFPPGIIPLVDLEENDNPSLDSSIASLSDSDDEIKPTKRKTKAQLKKNSSTEMAGNSLRLNDSIDVTEFWNSPQKTSKKNDKLKTLSADCITLDDSVTSIIPDDVEVVLDEDKFEDEENERELQREHTIKLRFKGQIHRISITKSDYFKTLFESIAKIGNVSFNDISIYHKEKPVDQFDTLLTIPLKISDILEAYILEPENQESTRAGDENLIQLKVQTKDRKDVVNVSIRREDTMQVLMDKYASLKGAAASKFKFIFDGELLDPDETPLTLELEGDERIDVYPV